MNKQEVYAEVLSRYQDEDSIFDSMTFDDLLAYRFSVSKELKRLDSERREADERILDYLSEAELKRGVTTHNGGLLKLRSRTSWRFPEQVNDEIKLLKKLCIDSGQAESLSTSYIVATDA